MTARNENSQQMAEWLVLLKNYNNNRPLPIEMTKQFEKHFEYFWKNDKNYAVATEEDFELLTELPNHI